MLAPVVICAVILGFLDLEFNNNILPDANHSARVLASDIQRKKPTFSILPGEFSNESLLPGYSLFAAKRNDQTGELGDVVIYDHTNGLELNTITAKQAMLKFTSNYQSLVVTLRSGEIHQSYRNDRSQYRKGTFDFYEIVIPTSGFELTREEESSRGDRELSADDLMAYINNRSESAERMRANLKNSLESFVNILTTYIPIYTDSGAPPRASQIADQLRQPLFMISDNASQTRGVENDKASYLVEYHKKYALPVACIVFLLVGAPLGALARRGGIGMGVGLSLGFFILYWSALIGGEKLADRGIMAPWVGMWAANILLTALGLILVIRVLREAPLWKKR
jgi:lipopolysaccharide export system permease protein